MRAEPEIPGARFPSMSLDIFVSGKASGPGDTVVWKGTNLKVGLGLKLTVFFSIPTAKKQEPDTGPFFDQVVLLSPLSAGGFRCSGNASVLFYFCHQSNHYKVLCRLCNTRHVGSVVFPIILAGA